MICALSSLNVRVNIDKDINYDSILVIDEYEETLLELYNNSALMIFIKQA